MTEQLENAQKMGKDQLEDVKSSGASVTRGLQAIAYESADFSKRYLESVASFTEKLAGARSIETLVQLQTDFAKTQLEAFMSQASKLGDIYQDIAKDAFHPVQAAVSRSQEAIKKS